jgi:hypothetical protein
MTPGTMRTPIGERALEPLQAHLSTQQAQQAQQDKTPRPIGAGQGAACGTTWSLAGDTYPPGAVGVRSRKQKNSNNKMTARIYLLDM